MNKILLTTFATFILTLATLAQPGDLLSPTAKAEFEKQNFAPCIAEMSKLIALKPKNDAAFVERARCLFLSADDNKDEERILAEKLKTIPDKDKAQAAVRAEIMSMRNKAIADASKAITLNPKNANAYNIRGLVKSSLGKKERAEAIGDFDKAIEIDPKFIKPYFNRGSSKADKSDYDGAIADFTKVIELDPNNIAARENRVAAMIGKNPGKPNLEAFNELKALTKLSPANEQNYYLAGVECFKFPNKYECVDFFKQYTAAFPKSYEAFIGLARAAASVEYYSDFSSENKLNYWKVAVEAYDKTFQLKPNDIQSYIEIIDLAIDKFRNVESAEDLSEAAVGLFPDNPQSYILAGRAAIAARKYDKAVTDLTRAIELSPTSSLAYTYRGIAFNYLNNLSKSIADLNKAIELNGNNGKAFMNRGALFETQKKYQEAIADYSQADRLNETCAKTNRGRVYVRIAFDNKELQNSENFKIAHQNFINDDAKKCFDTHYQYGVTLYAEAFNKEAAEQFDLAFNVYKKFNYDTTKIVEWQNRLKQQTAAKPPPTSSFAQGFVEAFKADSIKNGFTVVKSGVYDYEPNSGSMWQFDVRSNEFYLFMAVKEVYDPTFGMDIIYDGNGFIRPTNDWSENSFVVNQSTQYGMQYLNKQVKNASVFTMKLSLTRNSNIRQIQFSPAGKVTKIYWAMLKLK